MALMWRDSDGTWLFLPPAVDAEDLATHVHGVYASDTAEFDRAWTMALALVQDTLHSAHRAVSDDVLTGLYLEVGSEFYRRKDSPSGSSQYAQFEGGGGPIRSPRDPLTQSWPILRRYVVAF